LINKFTVRFFNFASKITPILKFIDVITGLFNYYSFQKAGRKKLTFRFVKQFTLDFGVKLSPSRLELIYISILKKITKRANL